MNEILYNNNYFHYLDERDVMLELKLLALTPFVMTALLSSLDTSNSFIQYGALGICGFAVFMLFKQLSEIRANHAIERQNLVEALAKQNECHKIERTELISSLKELDNRLVGIMERHIKATTTLANALHDRPCLIKDSRITDET